MTEQEQKQLLALDKCRFGQREFDKRFARDLASQIRRKVAQPLSQWQRYTLAKMVYRYRRQLAKWLPESLILQQPPTEADYGINQKTVLVQDMFSGDHTPPHEVEHG